MSNLSDIDRRYLEKLLGMDGGYVLDYTDPRYGAFFERYGVTIHSAKYQVYGTSKAKKMRAFWELEPDALVSKVLQAILEGYEADCDLNKKQIDLPLLKKVQGFVARLSGAPPVKAGPSEDEFLNQEFSITNLQRLPIEAQIVTIIEGRLSEAQKALRAGAFLSVVLLCGSVLEAVLLGVAQRKPADFNRAHASPKERTGGAKPLDVWTLSQFIDVACELRLLEPDIKTFSHGLRDFRNYIHPYQQLMSGFTPDEHTAKVCFQVLKAALASISGERG